MSVHPRTCGRQRPSAVRAGAVPAHITGPCRRAEMTMDQLGRLRHSARRPGRSRPTCVLTRIGTGAGSPLGTAADSMGPAGLPCQTLVGGRRLADGVSGRRPSVPSSAAPRRTGSREADAMTDHASSRPSCRPRHLPHRQRARRRLKAAQLARLGELHSRLRRARWQRFPCQLHRSTSSHGGGIDGSTDPGHELRCAVRAALLALLGGPLVCACAALVLCGDRPDAVAAPP